jgi:hypothetical protein
MMSSHRLVLQRVIVKSPARAVNGLAAESTLPAPHLIADGSLQGPGRSPLEEQQR